MTIEIEKVIFESPYNFSEGGEYLASLQECLKNWEKNTIIYLHYIQGMSANEYNSGFADGLEMALKSFQEHVKECSDYQITEEVDVK